MSWSARRQLLYALVALALVLAFGGWISYSALSTPASCTDGKQNQNEAGADCGGPCAVLCPQQSRAPIVLWTRAFAVSTSTYTVAAYIENDNRGAGAYRVPYSFRLFDERNILVLEKQGVFDIPPMEIVPLVVSNIDVGTRSVSRAFLEFSGDPVWVKIPAEALPTLRVSNQELAADASRLSASVVNQSNSDIRNVRVVAVLYDRSGAARAASVSTLERIARNSSEPVVFTWPDGFADIVRADVVPVAALPKLP